MSTAKLLALIFIALLPGGLFMLVGAFMWRRAKVDRVIVLNAPRERDQAGAYLLYPLESWHKYARRCYPLRYWLTETIPARFRRKESL